MQLEWKPIHTHPKDKEILCMKVNLAGEIECIGQFRWSTDPMWKDKRAHDKDGIWTASGDMGCDGCWRRQHEFTHWCELPLYEPITKDHLPEEYHYIVDEVEKIRKELRDTDSRLVHNNNLLCRYRSALEKVAEYGDERQEKKLRATGDFKRSGFVEPSSVKVAREALENRTIENKHKGEKNDDNR